ncbi:hypothetical protein HS088_TW19G00145 [Tripterygium wilfordii]|uniref:Uncharacterized protein n=1 Tax=Tripterygium wilfordii TaxID=458696 RepID=A0A7J7C8S6_TRIWF|nr:hypothetical protein HS088_TW19G00145 [Tripterygium wilfordii]
MMQQPNGVATRPMALPPQIGADQQAQQYAQQYAQQQQWMMMPPDPQQPVPPPVGWRVDPAVRAAAYFTIARAAVWRYTEC